MDRERYEELVRTSGARAFGAARRVCGRDDLAEDAVQEAFLALWRGRARPGADEDPGDWLVWQAARRAANAGRSDRRRRRREVDRAMNTNTERDVSAAGEPGGLLASREERAALEVELARLPGDERASVALRFAGGATYARIGEALGVGEATAHDRVRRGLERLRRALAGAGFAALAGSLERNLAASVPRAPSGLEARLAALAAAPAVAFVVPSAAARWAVAATVLALTGWLGLRSLAGPPEQGPASGLALPAIAQTEPAAEPSAEPSSAAARSEPPTRVSAARAPSLAESTTTLDEEPARIVGRIVDDRGRPVPGASVTLVSAERQGKRRAFSAAALAGADGRFALAVELPPESRDAEPSATLHVALRGAAVGRAPARTLRPGEATDWGDVELPRAAIGEAGAYALELLLVDASGAPVPDVEASVEHVSFPDGLVPPALDRAALERARFGEEACATSDAFGAVRLAGERTGPKRFRLRAPDGAWAPADWTWNVGSGESVHRVVLERPLTLEVGVTDLMNGLPVEATVNLVRAGVLDRWIRGAPEGDGRFAVAGLGRGPHLLRADAEGYSPVRRWIEVGEGPLALELKRADDPRDVGDHAAEIHGRVVRARDGAPMAVADSSVEVFSFWDELPDDLDVARDFLPNHVDPPPVQRMAMGEPPPPSDAFHRTGLAGGTYLLHVHPRGFGRATVGPIRLAPEEVVAGVEVALDAPAELEVVVAEAPDGARVLLSGVGPYSAARVRAADAEIRAAAGRGFLPGRPVREGRVVLERLPAGTTFVAWVLDPDREPAQSLPVLVRAGERARVDLEPGRRR